jgi:hypothetical protein
MTLKEKLHDEYIWTTEPIMDAEEVSESVDKMIEIANEFTIKFSEWKDKNCFNQGDGFYNRNYKDEALTLGELLEIYKKEKGL